MGKQLGLLIDKHRCVGCRTCMIACKMENRIPDNLFRMKVYNQEDSITNDRPTGKNGNELSWTPIPCMQCRKPKCLEACPQNAIIKREADGIVYIDYNKCNGCEQCIAACPYGVPEFMAEYKKGDKCNLCMHRIDVGKNPICVDCCPSRAIKIGDVSNKNSAISKEIKAANAKVINVQEGTNPSVYYKL